MSAAVVQHSPPTRRGRGKPKAKKAQRGFGKDRPSHSNAGLNQNRLNDVWQNMINENSEAWRPKGACCLDEVKSFDFENLSSCQPGISHPANAGESKNQSIKTWPQKSDEGDRQQNAGEGQQRIDDHHSHKRIQCTTDVTGKSPNQNPGYSGEQNNCSPYSHAYASTQKNAGEDITSQLVVSKRMLPGRP